MTLEHFAATLALIGIVILVASLLSGAAERSGIPEAAVFLLLGALVGPVGLGLVRLTLRSPALQVIATLGLVLVLFSDAISVDARALRCRPGLALAVLGPGTLIPAALAGGAGWLLLGLSPLEAVILGAVLASTDPVLVRPLLRGTGVPADARLALRLESGTNDLLLLPLVVLATLALGRGSPGAPDLARHAVGLLLLGPALGVAVGSAAILLLERVRARTGVRRDYESLYALGVAFTAYAAAEAVGGSGFLAAFAAGAVIAALDVELCDCFVDYGAATAEMFLLLAFVAFGGSLIWSGLELADGRALAVAAVALLGRTAVLLPVLPRLGLDRESARIVAWAGPRGLSSLLLALLPVFAGLSGAERLFALTCLVVLLSIALHGTGIALYCRARRRGGGPPRPGPAEAVPAAAPASAASVPAAPDGAERITVAELRRLWEDGRPVVVADVRTERSYDADPLAAKGALRLPPDDAVRRAAELRLARDAPLVLFCA